MTDTLRDRIAAALRSTPSSGWTYTPGQEKWDHHRRGDQPGHRYSITCALCVGDVYALADAVLPLVAAEREAEAHPPVHRWRVEVLDGDDRWVPYSGLKTDRDEAVWLLHAGERSRPRWADGTPVQRRLVRETTTYVVEDARADAEDGAQ